MPSTAQGSLTLPSKAQYSLDETYTVQNSQAEPSAVHCPVNTQLTFQKPYSLLIVYSQCPFIFLPIEIVFVAKSKDDSNFDGFIDFMKAEGYTPR